MAGEFYIHISPRKILNTQTKSLQNMCPARLTQSNSSYFNRIEIAMCIEKTYPPRDTPTPITGASGYFCLTWDTTNSRSSVLAAQYVLAVYDIESEYIV